MTSTEPSEPGASGAGSSAPADAGTDSGAPDSGNPGSGNPGSGSGAPATPQSSAAAPTGLGATEIEALQLALRAENAALWSYALVAANNPQDRDTVTTMREAHLLRRDGTASLLVDNGVEPEPPAVAYATPPAKDRKTALVLAFGIEADCQRAWRNVVATTDNNDLRSLGTTALTDAAVRYTEWKTLAKSRVRTTPFPGAPEPG